MKRSASPGTPSKGISWCILYKPANPEAIDHRLCLELGLLSESIKFKLHSQPYPDTGTKMQILASTHPLLEVKGLKIGFRSAQGHTLAVKGIRFGIGRGKTLGIVGESGSGKSVTALSVMGLLPSDAAEVTAESLRYTGPSGTPVQLDKLPAKALRALRGKDIAMIFQEPMTSLNPVMRCGRQVAEILHAHGTYSEAEAKARVLQLFQEVKLPRPEQIFTSWPHQLSGGQKQRVMIAMAMACNPSLLIADEPTTALDVTVQKTILALMKELQQKYDTSILFITHDLGLIRQMADEVLVMHNGNIVEQGPMEQVFSNPVHPYTRGLLACRPRMDSRPLRLPTVKDYLDSESNIQISRNQPVLITSENRQKAHEILYARQPLLRVENLCTWFPVKRDILGRPLSFVKAVDGVRFNVYPGETLGLVGESGSGKTTLGRSMIGLIPWHSGEVYYNDEALSRLNAQDWRLMRRRMQIIFQDPFSSLNPRLTAGEAIQEPMRIHKLYPDATIRKQKTLELMDRVGLADAHYQRYPHEFSGGQRQRIGIARALAVAPEFIVCDESVSALDVSVQAQVLNLLNELKEAFGLTYVFISHDLSVVRYMSDRIMVMKDGQIVEEGEADALCATPGEDYTRQLIDAIPF